MSRSFTLAQATRLAALEAEFEQTGGRGVDLADEIDALRFARDHRTRTITLAIDFDPQVTDDPLNWDWASLLDEPADRILIEAARLD